MSLKLRVHMPGTVIVLAVSLFALGCGGDDGNGGGEKTSADKGAGSSDAKQAGESKSNGDQVASANGLRIDSEGNRWYGDIPLDVWLEDPLDVVADASSTGAGSGAADTETVTADAAPTTETDAPAAAPAAGAAGADWGKLIPPQVIDNEVKKTANRLKEKTLSVGAFNSGFLELPPYIATMSALAVIAARHPEEVRWKENALAVAAIGGSMLSEPLRRGAGSMKKLQAEYEPVAAILQGSTPAGLPEADEGMDFADVADIGDLMKRLEVAQNWLTVNVSSGDALAANKEDVLHEAHVLAALSQVIATEGYGYSEDNDFLGHSVPMLEASLKIVQAANDGDFAAYETSLSRIMQSCTECHSAYRN